jgi:hypothetical protein
MTLFQIGEIYTAVDGKLSSFPTISMNKKSSSVGFL